MAVHYPVPKYESPSKFAKRIGSSRATVYREIAKGNIKTIKFNKQRLVDVPVTLDWMETLPAA